MKSSVILIPIVAVLCFCAGRLTGRLTLLPAIDSRAPVSTVWKDDRHFADVVASWNAYISSHGGWLPVDFISTLAALDKVNGYGEARQYTFGGAPPRINPDLELNPKWEVFRYENRTGDVYTCFADGTWARGATSLKPSTDWEKLWQAAGYPRFFKSTNEMQGWLSANCGRIVWDTARRMYVLQPAPTTTPAIGQESETLQDGQR